jgi:hypothetical protein
MCLWDLFQLLGGISESLYRTAAEETAMHLSEVKPADVKQGGVEGGTFYFIALLTAIEP